MNIIDDFIKLDMDAPQIAERTEKDLAFNRKVKSCYHRRVGGIIRN